MARRAGFITRRFLFPAAVAAALGFGGAQAVASPAEGAARAAVCDPEVCYRICRAIGAFGGTCLSNGSCVCYIGQPPAERGTE